MHYKKGNCEMKSKVRILSCYLIAFIIIGLGCINKHYEVYSQNSFRVPILEFHNITPKFDFANRYMDITPANFIKDLKYFKDNGYTTITFDELEKSKNGSFQLPKKPIILTFDDGYESFYKYAFPVLKQFNMKANLNIIVSSVGEKKSEVSFVTWDEIKEMTISGLVELGSHTYGLHSKTLLQQKTTETKDQYFDRVYNDFLESRMKIFTNTYIETDIFCFPFGEKNKTLINAAKKAGFKVLLTSDRGIYNSISSLSYVHRFEVNGLLTSKHLVSKICMLQ